ncbi:Tim10/DDP family zinc finger domain-containing protein [Trichoderma novae-zelandiae]
MTAASHTVSPTHQQPRKLRANNKTHAVHKEMWGGSTTFQVEEKRKYVLPKISSSSTPRAGQKTAQTKQLLFALHTTTRTQTTAKMDMLSSAEQRTLEQRMQKRQVKEFVGAFGGLVEHCFTSCIDDFTSKSLSTKETGCLNRCVLKWMATQQRVSERFQEHNAQITQQMQK